MKKQLLFKFTQFLFQKSSFGITAFALLTLLIAPSSFAQQWGILGNETQIADVATNYPSIAVVGEVPYVVYTIGTTSGICRVKKLNATTGLWEQVGGDLSANVSYSRIFKDNAGKLYVAYMDNGNSFRLAVKTFDGTNWVAPTGATDEYVSTGSADLGTNPAGATNIRCDMAFTSGNVPYIAYTDATHPVVKSFVGGSWTAVGTLSATDISGGNSIALDASDVPYLVYINATTTTTGPIKTLRYDGTAWVDISPVSPVGTAPTTAARHTSIAIDVNNNLVVSYKNASSISIIRCTIATGPPLTFAWDLLQTLTSSGTPSDYSRNSLIRDTDGNLYSAFYTKKSSSTYHSKVQVYKRTGNGNFVELINTQVSTGIDYASSTNTASQNTITNLAIALGSNTTKPYVVYNKVNSSSVSTPFVRVFEPLTTWDGTTWSNGDPDAGKSVKISANYTPIASFSAGNITVDTNAALLFNSGINLTVAGNIAVASGSSLTLENNANLIQTRVTAINTGNIVVKRNSNALYRLDYTMWSSPVSGQKLADFSPLTSQSPSRFYTYDSVNNIYVADATPTTTTFVNGTGYLIRMPNTDPTSGYDAGAATLAYPGVFTGVPNNGSISLSGLTSDKYYAVGNPYPSTISANLFLSGNATAGTLYFWRKKNNAAATSYATYTTAGGVANTGGDPNNIAPNGTIQVGQGFIVKTGVAATTLSFNNTMRTSNNGNQILKIKPTEKSRIWLNLASKTGGINQMMVAYMDGATTDIDEAIDGEYINDAPTALTSNINDKEFVIQGRGLPFEDTDVVPLTFKTSTAGTFTIALDHVDGLFSGKQDIYLKDNVTGTEHDIKSGAYTFESTAGTFDDRLAITYKSSNPVDVKNPVLAGNTIVVYKQNQTIKIQAGNTIADVKVYDLNGRLLVNKKSIGSNEATIAVKLSNIVYLVKVTTVDGTVVTKKIL